MTRSWIVAFAAFAALGACSITQTVKPVETDRIAAICIEQNDRVAMQGFLPELESLIQARGIRTQIYLGALPADCTYRLSYTANWGWDLAVYLTYARLDVYEGATEIGNAEYDARSGSGNLDKFGPTRSKLETLVAALFP